MAHILLIYDDTELTGLLKEVLSYEGFEVSEANDGPQVRTRRRGKGLPLGITGSHPYG